jgi:PAS domain S-box-containing protein
VLIIALSLGIIFLELFFALRLYRQKMLGFKAYFGLVFVLLISMLIILWYANSGIDNPKILQANYILTNTLATILLLFLVISHLPSLRRIKLIWWIIPVIGIAISFKAISSIGINFISNTGTFKTPLPFDIWQWVFICSLFQNAVLGLALAVVINNISFRKNALSPAFWVGVAVFLLLLPDILGIDFQFGLVTFQTILFIISTLIIGIVLNFLNKGSLFLSRRLVVDSMTDGWLLIDADKKILDINSSARRLLGLSKDNLYGKDATSVLNSLPSISAALNKGQDIEMHTYLSSAKKTNYIHIRLSRISTPNRRKLGYLLLIRDDTERQKINLARQQARDEMFSLLHSIASAASGSEDANEFVDSVVYQLNYSFQADATAIFLTDAQLAKDRLLLISQIGVDSKNLKKISFISKDLDLLNKIILQQTHILISNNKSEDLLPDNLQDVFNGNVLFMPVFSDDIFVGLIVMARHESSFRKDDIARIDVAAKQIGSFVYRDRRINAASTIAERQRLIRDLHDSVTQRLYSLVMMTESARIGFKLNTLENPLELIEELGFSARQALKEMRLFLYKLQPVDLRSGFVSALRKRLDMVEGRAGLSVSLEIDETISMSTEADLHLYMITQEALNNIIQHANATDVRIAFYKSDGSLNLEIEDNGGGFSVQEKDSSGVGLSSMAERAELLGGNMKLSSSPGVGTKLNITIPEEVFF